MYDRSSIMVFLLMSNMTNLKKTKAGQYEDLKKDKGKNPHAVVLGRLGGLKGGKARAEKLTPYERTEIAKKAAEARWSKKK